MPTILPRSPDLQHIWRRAKQLLHEHREGNRSVVIAFAITRPDLPVLLSEILIADFSLRMHRIVVAVNSARVTGRA